MPRRQRLRGGREGNWRAEYEELRAAVLAGAASEGEAARRLGRFGLAGLVTGRPAWEVVVSQAPEPRWTGTEPRLMSLKSAYQLVVTGGAS